MDMQVDSNLSLLWKPIIAVMGLDVFLRDPFPSPSHAQVLECLSPFSGSVPKEIEVRGLSCMEDPYLNFFSLRQLCASWWESSGLCNAQTE